MSHRRRRSLHALVLCLPLALALGACSKDDCERCPDCPDAAPPSADMGASDLAADASKPPSNTSRLTSYEQVRQAFVDGYTVRAVIHYAGCDIMIPGHGGPGPDVTGGMEAPYFDLHDEGANPYVEFSKSSVVWIYRSGAYRYVYDFVRMRVYKDGKVDAQAHYFDTKTFAVLMDEPLGCKIDPGDDSGKRYGVSLFKVQAKPRPLYGYKELMHAVRSGEVVTAIVRLKECKRADGSAGPALVSSVHINVFEQFSAGMIGPQAYLVASHRTLVSSPQKTERRYLRVRLRDNESAEAELLYADPVAQSNTSSEKFACSIDTGKGGSVTLIAR